MTAADLHEQHLVHRCASKVQLRLQFRWCNGVGKGRQMLMSTVNMSIVLPQLHWHFHDVVEVIAAIDLADSLMNRVTWTTALSMRGS